MTMLIANIRNEYTPEQEDKGNRESNKASKAIDYNQEQLY